MNELRITTVQNVLYWEDEQANLQMFEQQLVSLQGQTDLVILPEMFNSGFSMSPQNIAQFMQGSTVLWMREQASRLNAAICGSIAVEEQGVYFNRFIFMRPSGEFEFYDKRHCFRMSGEHLVYSAGKTRLVIEYLGWRILPQVCYDLRFPVFSRNNNDYDLALYVANWPKIRRKPWQVLSQARSIENSCYLAAVNRVGHDGNGIEYSGDSLIVDFKGDVLSDQQEKISVQTQSLDLPALQLFREKFPAWKDADDFALTVE
ncbi:MAG: omega-amidase [Oceanospirillaceae bacterium]|jgi:omega-amidase